MSAVSTIKPHLRDIAAPDLLRNLPAWLVWRYEHLEGEHKPRKTPYYTGGGKRHGAHGRPEDRQNLTSFDAAKAAAARRGMDGVGFCPMPEWGITALDFDSCVADGGVDPSIERLVAGTYAEFSPSGNGVRAFVRGTLVGNRKSNRGQVIGFETFSSNGFVTFTGNRLPITDLTDAGNVVADPSPELLALCSDRFGRVEAPDPSVDASETPPLGLSTSQLRDALDVLPKDLHYDDWLRVGMALHHETSGEGFYLWDDWSADSPKYTSSDYGLSKWQSFGKGGQRPTTVHALVRMANEHGAHIDIATAEAGDDFQVIEDAAPAVAKPNRFAVEPLDVFASRKPPEWIVKGVIPDADLIVLFGESGAGKSFIALDLAGAIARGVEWRGRRVRQGRVVYIAAEGAGGFRNRVAAYCAEHQLTPAEVPIGVIANAPNLLQRDDALEVSRAIVAAGGADLVIVDTFAQVTPGANENAAEDMGKALTHCRGIRAATRAPVLLVHHSGKDASRGARGWSGLKAAADAELEVTKTVGGRSLRTSKQKDGEDGLAWGFDLKVLTIGEDADGDAVTSCVVVEAELPAVQQVGQSARKLGPVEALVNAVIQEFAQSQTSGIEVEAVVAEAARRLTGPSEGKRDQRKAYAKRALKTLCAGDESPYFVEDNCIEVL